MTKEQILQQFGGDEKAFYAQFPTKAHYDEYCKGGMIKYGNGGKIARALQTDINLDTRNIQPAIPQANAVGNLNELKDWTHYSNEPSQYLYQPADDYYRKNPNVLLNEIQDPTSKIQQLNPHNLDEYNSYYRNYFNPRRSNHMMVPNFKAGGNIKYGNGGMVNKKKFNFGGTVNVLDARQGAIDSTKQGINHAASIYGTVVGEVANVAAMVATAGASGAAGAGAADAGAANTASNTAQMVNSVQNGGAGSLAEANSMNASNAINTAKTVNNVQNGGKLKTGNSGGLGDALANKNVSGIGGMVKSTIELEGKIGAELFGKGISDTQNRSVYGGLNQTNQAKEKYLGIENTADVYGQRPGSMMAEGGITVPQGGNLYGPSHEGGGIPIEAEGGEAVIKKEAVRKFAPILSAINQSVGGNPITPGQSTSYAENGTLVQYPWNPKIANGNPTKDNEQRSWQEDELLMKKLGEEKSYNPNIYAAHGFDYGHDNNLLGGKSLEYKHDTPLTPGINQPEFFPRIDDSANSAPMDRETGLPTPQNEIYNSFPIVPTNSPFTNNTVGQPNYSGIPSVNQPDYSAFPGSPDYSPNYPPNPNEHDPDGFLWRNKKDEPTDTIQYEPKPGYGMEAVEIGSSVASLINNALQRYHAGPKPIPMTAEEERTNRFVERNTDLAHIATTDAMANASNKTSSSSGKLAAQLGVYSNSINKKMDSEAKWYSEEEAAKNRNISLRNTVSNANRTELNAYNANEAINRNQFKQTKAQMISNDVNNAIETAANWDESRKADATSMIQMDAYSKMIQIPQLTAQWSASKELRDKYETPSAYANAVMDQDQFNNVMSKNTRWFRPVKKKKK